MNPVDIRNFIGVWVVLILAITLLSAAHKWANPTPIVKNRLEVLEAFANVVTPDPIGDTSRITNISPSATSLDKPRESYSLLGDVLKPFTGAPTSPTSKTCYEADFQTRLERTGNFRQMTNNYKRGVPDSCSAPNHDLTLSFYKIDPLV